MPHWIPPTKDNIVYATIDEALSGSKIDIEAYLLKPKRDLNIGEEGYPNKLVIADQQTYALVCFQVDPGGHTEGEVCAPTAVTVKNRESPSYLMTWKLRFVSYLFYFLPYQNVVSNLLYTS